MTIGKIVSASRACDVMDYCEDNSIDYGIWNAADFWMGKGKIDPEFTFDSHEDADKVIAALNLPILRETNADR